MKKMLLLLCAIPCLISAQTSIQRELNSKFLNGILIKDTKIENKLLLRCDSVDNLPDTIYTYLGEEKHMVYMDAITYDEEGRKKFVSGRININGNSMIDEHDGRYKEEYTYKEAGDSIIIECIVYDHTEETGWRNYKKEISIKKKSNIRIGYYSYEYHEDDWFLLSQTNAAEFNERGLPVVMKRALFFPSDPDKSYVLHTEVLYDKNDLDSVHTFFLIVKSGLFNDTIPYEKDEYTYDANKRLSKHVHSGYYKVGKEWEFGFKIEYTYDERGNLASQIRTSDYGTVTEKYYKNIYSSTVSNELVFPVQSTVYPNPVSDVLHITIQGTEQAVITLIRADGSIVTKQEVNQPITTISINSFVKGYYFLKVETIQGTKTHKVIIK